MKIVTREDFVRIFEEVRTEKGLSIRDIAKRISENPEFNKITPQAIYSLLHDPKGKKGKVWALTIKKCSYGLGVSENTFLQQESLCPSCMKRKRGRKPTLFVICNSCFKLSDISTSKQGRETNE